MKNKGFTLIELAIVTVIIALIVIVFFDAFITEKKVYQCGDHIVELSDYIVPIDAKVFFNEVTNELQINPYKEECELLSTPKAPEEKANLEVTYG